MKGGSQASSSTQVLNSARNHGILPHITTRCSWETLPLAETLRLLEQGRPPSVEELAYILQKCRREKDVESGVRLHAYICQHGLEVHQSLGNYLVPMLVDVGRLHDAQEVCDRLPHPNEYSWNALLLGYVKCGNPRHALALYKKMRDDSVYPSGHAFIALLNACAKLKDEEKGNQLHIEIIRKGMERDFLIGSSLVNMYSKFGSLALAQGVFDELEVRDAITWTSLIAGYAKLGHGQQALTCFDKMQQEGMLPNPLTLVCSLKACGYIGAVDKGQLIHAEIARRGMSEDDAFVGNAVMDMYVKCGLVVKAREVFDQLPLRDVVSWNTLMTGFSTVGDASEAFECLKRMEMEKVSPDAVTLVCNLKACSSAGDVDKGKQLHAEIVVRGLCEGAPLVDNALVDMYASCGLLHEAREVFDSLRSDDAVVWTALIAGYHKHGFGEEALCWFQKMQAKGVKPDVVTYVCSLKACSSIPAIHTGREIHFEIERLQLLERYSVIGIALVDFYANCGLLSEAEEVFDKLPDRDIVTWNTLISGYMMYGYGDDVLKSFEQMQLENFDPDAYTFLHILKACGSMKNVVMGHEIHHEITCQMLTGGHCDIGTALLDMYFSCGAPLEAQNVFNKLPVQDLSSWNALTAGYLNHGMCYEALSCLQRMKQGGLSPGSCAYACGLKAGSSVEDEDNCRGFHGEIVKKGLLENAHLTGVSPLQSTVLWNALITAYTDLDYGEEALSCLKFMRENCISLDTVSYVCSLKACGITGAVEEGQWLHGDLIKIGIWENDLMIGTALIDMYTSCCMLAESQMVFNKLAVQDAIAWNTLISGHSKHGYDQTALEFLERMKLQGVLPSAVTYVCSLNACGNSKALKRGQALHVHVSSESLERDSIGNALVTMYAKCGLLAKAHCAFEKVSERDASSWNVLIAEWSKQALGEEALAFYEQMQREGIVPDPITYVCSLNACGSVGAIEKGRAMHAAIIKRGLLTKESLAGNGLVDMYVKCGSLAEARKVFDTLPARDTVSWNTLIIGNVNGDCGEGALYLLRRMQHEHVPLDSISYICSLKACGSMGVAEDGRNLHADILKKDMLKGNLVIGNALIDMYVGCVLLAEAEHVLKRLSCRDVVSWTTVIAGFLKHGRDKEALDCLKEMEQDGVSSDVLMWNALIAGYSHLGQAEKACCVFDRMNRVVKPDGDSFLSILAACSHTGLVDKAQANFNLMEKAFDFIPTMQHFTCMVDLFGRVGQLDEAIWVVNRMPLQPDIVAWHTISAACQRRGNVILGTEAFESAMMLDENDAATFVSMFNIYAGAVNQEAKTE